MFQGPPRKHERDAQKYLESIEDGYVFDVVYKPNSYAEQKHAADQKPGSDKWHRFFTNPKRDWVAIVISIATLLVVGAYTEFAHRQWKESQRTAKAGEDSVLEARKQLNLSRRIANAERGATFDICNMVATSLQADNIEYGFALFNVGKGTAVNIRIFHETKILDSEPRDGIDPKDKAIRIYDSDLGKPNPNPKPCPAPQNGNIVSTAAFRQGTNRLYLYGTIWYEDSTGPQWRQFCSYFVPKGNVCLTRPTLKYCACIGHNSGDYEN
jgi:hypothetical protein